MGLEKAKTTRPQPQLLRTRVSATTFRQAVRSLSRLSLLTIPQRLKPFLDLGFVARLKSCPSRVRVVVESCGWIRESRFLTAFRNDKLTRCFAQFEQCRRLRAGHTFVLDLLNTINTKGGLSFAHFAEGGSSKCRVRSPRLIFLGARRGCSLSG